MGLFGKKRKKEPEEQERIRELEQQITRLGEEKLILRSQLADAQAETAEARENYGKVETDYKKLQADYEKLTAGIEETKQSLQDKISELQGLLSKKEEQYSAGAANSKREYEAEISGLKEAIEGLNQEKSEIELRCQQLSEEYQKIESRMNKKKKKPGAPEPEPLIVANPDVVPEVGKEFCIKAEHAPAGMEASCKGGVKIRITNVGELVVRLDNTLVKVYGKNEDGIYLAERL
jgi:uncharacterized phage infection (PIP) family protein YhgE